MSTQALRVTAAFALILELEVALIGTNAGRYCTSTFDLGDATLSMASRR